MTDGITLTVLGGFIAIAVAFFNFGYFLRVATESREKGGLK